MRRWHFNRKRLTEERCKHTRLFFKRYFIRKIITLKEDKESHQMTQKKEACKLLTDNQVREVRSTHRKAT